MQLKLQEDAYIAAQRTAAATQKKQRQQRLKSEQIPINDLARQQS